MDNNTYMHCCKYCRNCNKQIDFQFNFCDKCGSQLEIIYPNTVFQQPQLQYNTPNTFYYQSYGGNSNYQNSYSTQATNLQYTYIVGFILSVIGLIGCIISVFVPYVSANTFGYSESRSMLDNTSDSYIILVLSVIGILATISKSGIANIIVGVINSAIGIIHIIYLNEKFSELDEYTATFAKIGPAVYILAICGILTFFGGCTILASRYNEKHFGRK